MSLPVGTDLAQLCQPLLTIEELSVIFPGSAVLSAQAGYTTGDASEVVKSMLAQLNTAMVPLTPFFNILDFVKACFDCLTSIPEAIVTLNPTPIINCLGKIGPVVNKLLALLPPVPIFVTVRGTLSVIILGLEGMKEKIHALIAQQARIAAAAAKAAAVGNLGLQVVVDCSSARLTAQLANLNAEFQPLNRLIGVINVLLELASFPCVPALGGLAEVSEASLDVIQAVIDLLRAIRDSIPVEVPALPGVTSGQCL